jgi:MurNAc alpha-1-phosphate uridylyltransferase
MIEAFDPARMDTLLLLATLEGSVGFDGAGDFFRDADGRLTRRGEAPRAPFAYAGAAIMQKADFAGRGDGEVFSLNALWNASLAQGRLFGLVLDGLWLHVGTPDAIGAAERAIAGSER